MKIDRSKRPTGTGGAKTCGDETGARFSRRTVLKGAAGAAATAATVGLPKSATAAKVTSARFVGMDAPAKAAEQATTTVESSLLVGYDDGSEQSFPLSYQPLYFTGDDVPDGMGGTKVAGGLYDVNGDPAMDPLASTPTQYVSNGPDGTSLLQVPGASVPGVQGNTVFAVVQYEYVSLDAQDNSLWGKLMSPIAVLTLDQDKETGALSLVKYSQVDQAAVHGLLVTCNGSLSPWGTHLSSEEYAPDANKGSEHADLRSFSQNFYGDPDTANHYHYGHLPEVVVNADGTGTLTKHYCTGRVNKELVKVMPDQRTLIVGDDSTNAGLFMFIADTAADLSAGTLYVGQASQREGVAIDQGGEFDLKWINLGHATSDEIEHLADTLTIADIVDVKTEDPGDAGYTAVGYLGKPNWVKFVPGMEKAAAFLETHRYAAAVGGTLAFTKMEGVTLNQPDKIVYMAMASIKSSMTDGSAGIQVDKISSGAVYQQQLADGQTDTAGDAIDSDWVPTNMSAVPGLVAVDLDSPDELGNTAHADHVASPDNLSFSEMLRTLYIGEDSGTHVNNFVWAFNVDTGELARLLSHPTGAEATGLHAVDDLNGFAYIMGNLQHPGDWFDLHAVVRADVEDMINVNYRDRRSSPVGYIAGLPKLG